MGLTKFEIWRSCHNLLKINLLELSLADFVWSGRNTYTFNRCFLILSGNGLIVNHSGGEKFKMRCGYGYFLPEYLDLEFDFPPGLRFLCWHFKLEVLPGIDAFRGQKKVFEFPLSIQELEKYRTLLETESDWPAICEFELFLWNLLRRYPFPKENDPARLESLRKRYGKLLAFVRARPSARLGIGELAEVSGMSRDTLSRCFSRDFGIPLKTFLMRELIASAERHLLAGDRSVKEISDLFEFSSEFYFSRFFKRHKGVSPSEFRKINRRH